ncbi:leucine-rich repeat domain-containing protein [Planctomycetota bacterium]
MSIWRQWSPFRRGCRLSVCKFSLLLSFGLAGWAAAQSTEQPWDISVGRNHVLVLKAQSVWTWGANDHGQLGLDPCEVPYALQPEEVADLFDIAAVSAGGAHSLALSSAGELWAWGSNAYGQLGDGTFVDKHTPVRVATNVKMTAVVAGDTFSLALDELGDVWAWGQNHRYQLGDGFLVDRSAPGLVTQNLNSVIEKLSAGKAYSLTVGNTSLYGWGQGSEQQLVYGQFIDLRTPTWLSYFSEITDGSAGGYHSLAIDSNDRVWAWGQNAEGQLGSGDFNPPNEPVLLFSDPNTEIRAISAGDYHSLAVDNNDTVWAWGSNTHGQLGVDLINDANAIALPIPVAINDVNVMDAGASYNLALDRSGLAWGWGTLPLNSSDVIDINQPVPTVIQGFPCLLDVSSTAGGTVLTPGIDSYITFTGDILQLEARADAGHQFLHWSGSAVEANLVDEENSLLTTLEILGDHTLQANFEPVSYSLTVTADEGGRIVVPNQSPIDANVLVPVNLLTEPIPGLEGYSFDRWVLLAGGQGDFADANNPNTTFSIQGDSQIIAVYKKVPVAGLVEPLLTVVMSTLNLSNTPTESDMERLKELYAPALGIHDLTGLQYARNLHTLDLNNNNVTDANVLVQLPSLRTLLLNNNGFADIETLTQMEQLVTLHLSDNDIADYEPFGRLKNLQHLLLNNTNQTLEDIPESWLTDLRELRVLGIFGNAGLRQSDPLVHRMHIEICYPNGGGVYASP